MSTLNSIAQSLSLTCSLVSAGALAHAFDSLNLPPEGVHAHLSVSGAYRTKGLVRNSETWTVPGTLMGGEAYPFEAGLGLDEVFLTPIFRSGETYAMLKIGKHAGAEELELDHALVGHRLWESVALEGGKIAAIFTPFNGEHPSDMAFSLRRLAYDVLWGGQYNDEGLRLKTGFLGLDLGAEAWRGRSFPATQRGSNRPAFDLYGRYSRDEGNIKIQSGGFFFDSKPQARQDDRYGGSHSHFAATVTTDATYFDGATKVYGGFGKIAWDSEESFGAGLQGELSQAKSKGTLRDTTREALFENRTLAYWGEAYFSFDNETLSFRSERLKVNNTIRGNAAAALSQKLGFLMSQKDPFRHTLSYQHAFDDSFRIRAEWIRDMTTVRKQDFYVVSAVLSKMVFHWGP